MVLRATTDALYDLAAGLAFNRAQLLAGATELDAMAGEDQTLLTAAASIRELATSIPHDIDPVDRKIAALLAAYLRGVAEQGHQTG
jgi:hypothetical protein